MYKAGDVLRNRYVILGVLGHGGSGCVYLAEDLNIGKRWAVKELDINAYGSKNFAESEIKMLKSIDHHCFPRITDAWQSSTHFYIVSDYIEGISLGRLLKDGPLSRIKTYKFAYQIAEAIEFLHLNNPPILYLDLKPDNIMLRPDGRVYLIDFGISSFLSDVAGGFGTKGFAAPEQYKMAESPGLDERADVYAFGKTYLTMRTGECHWPPTCVTSLNTSERKFISKCTHPDPNARLKSMSQVKKNLEHINFFYSGIKQKTVILVLGILAIMSIAICMHLPKKDYSVQMLRECSMYKFDGYYTEKGLDIIENYINSGLLNEEEANYYSFLVAITYFEKIKDYRSAERYFERLDENEYPEKRYYLEMCQLETGFDYDSARIYKSIMQFRDDVMKKKHSKSKYENLLFAAFCLENYCVEDNGRTEAMCIYNYILNALREERNCDDWSLEIIKITEERREMPDGFK